MEKRNIKRLCVYCGSAFAIKPAYAEAATDFTRRAVALGFEIVYGAGSRGLMGIVADAALEAGGKVTGVVPRQFDKEVVHQNLTDTIFVSSMSERKRLMLELSDAFVALPGGYGTLDEITEALTLLQLGSINKPCGFLNTQNFYTKFFEFLDNAVNENLLTKPHRDMALLSNSAPELLGMLQNYERPPEKLWWDESRAK